MVRAKLCILQTSPFRAERVFGLKPNQKWFALCEKKKNKKSKKPLTTTAKAVILVGMNIMFIMSPIRDMHSNNIAKGE
tara:strand:- start:458 stop:691 length:234 start_codon:yes stop_codon:yes gene_type:complete